LWEAEAILDEHGPVGSGECLIQWKGIDETTRTDLRTDMGKKDKKDRLHPGIDRGMDAEEDA